MTPEAKPEPQQERWICVGVRRVVGDKLAGAWQQLVDGQPHGPLLIYDKLARHVQAGMVYDVRCTRQGQGCTTHGAPAYVGRWIDMAPPGQRATITEQVVAWQAGDEATSAALRADKLEAKDGRADEVLRALRPLRLAYQRTDSRGKLALAALVLDYLRRPVVD